MSIEKLKDLKSKISELREESKKILKEAFEEGCKAIFAEYPRLKSFMWTQYTPYFMDGDECVFSANYWDLGINGGDPYDEDEDEGSESFEAEENAIQEFLKMFDDGSDDLKTLFGDHAKITITPSGAYVDEYQHD